MVSDTVRLRLIGRPELFLADRQLRLPTRKTLALLAILALSTHRRDRASLAALLWADRDAVAARRNLRHELHRLRHAGLDGAVDDDGDTLSLGAVEVDVHAFRKACATGDAAVAAACGPGPLLDGFTVVDGTAFDEWVAGERSRHRDQWADAAERHASALHRAGHLREALVLLDALCGPTGVDPLREAAVREAMRCQAALGEVDAALRRHERHARVLRDELGLEPLPETLALAEQLRAGAAGEPGADRAAVTRPSSRRDPMPSQVPFIGREEAIRTMHAAWSQGRAIVIDGEPGCGKTRLASDFAAAAGPFAVVACRPADGAIPYASAARAMRVLTGGGGLGALPEWVRGELARLLPKLAPPPPPIASPEQRARFVAAFATAWQALLDDDFRSVLIDDWQYADDSSIDLFVHLAQSTVEQREDGGDPTRLLIASRPIESTRHGARALAQLADGGLAERIEIAPLSAAELLALIQRLSGSAGAQRFAGRLHEATGGNPMFAVETLRHLFETGLLGVDAEGAWQTPFDDVTRDYRELPVPASVRETVLARVRGLGNAALRLLEAASLAGDPFTLARLDGSIALGELERVEAIERALAARLLVVDDPSRDGGPHYRHVHDLIPQSVAEAISPERARLLHRRLAISAERMQLPAERVAAHLDAAGDHAAANPWRLRAADEAEARYAHAEALAQLTLALHPALPAAERVRMQLRRAGLARHLLDRAEAEQALGDAERCAADDAATRHAVGLALARHALAGDDVATAMARLDAIVDDPQASDSDRIEARLTRVLALQKSGDARAGEALWAIVATLPATASGPRAHAFGLLGMDALRRGEWTDASDWFARAAGDYEAIGDLAGLAGARLRDGAVSTMRSDFDSALRLLEQALADATRAAHIGHQRGAILNLVKVCTQTGQLERAAELLERGMALSPQFSSPVEETAFHQSAYYVAYLRGELGDALSLAERVVSHADSLADSYWKVGARLLVLDLAILTGNHSRAERLIGEARAAGEGRIGGYHRALLAAKTAWLALELSDTEAAAGVLAELDRGLAADAAAAPISGEDALVVDHGRARLLLACGRIADAWAVVAEEAPRLSLDAWTMRAAARIAVARALGGTALPPPEAMRALADEVGRERLPPLESLRLGDELVAAWAGLGLAFGREARRLSAQVARRRLLLDARLAETGRRPASG